MRRISGLHVLLSIAVLLGVLALAIGAQAGAPKVSIRFNEGKWGKLPEKAVTNKAAQVVLVTATVHPAPHPEDMGFRYFHRRVEELSGGRVSTNYYPGGMLTNDARDLLDLNIKGDVDLTRHDSAAVKSISPSFELMSGLFLFDNPSHVYRFMERKEFLEPTRKNLEENNLVLLGSFAFARHLYTSKPVKLLNDLKGMKIRTMEIPVVMRAWNALGANATPLPFGELYTALQTGLVDGGEGSATAYFSNRFHEVAKYLNAIYYKYESVSLIMNQKKYASLPPDLKRAVDQAARETVDLIREVYADWEEDVFGTLRAQKAVVITQKEMQDFPKWRERVRDAKINEAVFKTAGEGLAPLVEQAR
jgi:tripartite ATP-independent transporter DctP family solute receptor